MDEDLHIEISSVKLDVKEQFVVLIVSTIAGFAANKLVESQLTNLFKNRKLSG